MKMSWKGRVGDTYVVTNDPIWATNGLRGTTSHPKIGEGIPSGGHILVVGVRSNVRHRS